MDWDEVISEFRRGEIVVSGRELHEFLEVGTRYDKWITRMIEYGFYENQDYVAVAQKRPTAQGNETTYIDHALKLDMAKEISMIQRNEGTGVSPTLERPNISTNKISPCFSNMRRTEATTKSSCK